MSSTEAVARVASLYTLSDEEAALLLSFLRASDLAVCQCTDRTAFSTRRLRLAAQMQMQMRNTKTKTNSKRETFRGTDSERDRKTDMQREQSLYIPMCSLPAVAPLGKQQLLACRTIGLSLSCVNSTAAAAFAAPGCNYYFPIPSAVHVLEVTNILAALTMPAPLSAHDNKAYWISSRWCTQAKRFYESLDLPLLGNEPFKEYFPLSPITIQKNTPVKKKVGRSKRQSLEQKPALSINSDLVCQHGGLSLGKNKRKLIYHNAWKTLSRYHGFCSEFKCSETQECAVCAAESDEAKFKCESRREAELATRRRLHLPDSLVSLALRKSGVPNHCTIYKWLTLTEQELDDAEIFDQAIQGLGLGANRPLVPGMYNLVPRNWMRLYRRYLKDPELNGISPLDCSSLLCYSHGLLVVPPHVEEYLVGIRRNLLVNLFDYQGEVVEIVSLDEWEALQSIFNVGSEFQVRFCLDGENISWNLGLCQTCDPFNYGPTASGLRITPRIPAVTIL